MYLYLLRVGGRGPSGARGYYSNSSQAVVQNGAEHDSALPPSEAQLLNGVNPAVNRAPRRERAAILAPLIIDEVDQPSEAIPLFVPQSSEGGVAQDNVPQSGWYYEV